MNITHRVLGAVAAAALSASVLVGFGCSGKPEAKLVGEWVADVEATTSTDAFKALPAPQQEMGRKGLEMFSSTVVAFTGDGKFSVKGPGMTEEGTFEIAKTEGDVLTVHSTRTKDGKTKDFPARLIGERVALTLFGNQAVIFKRR